MGPPIHFSIPSKGDRKDFLLDASFSLSYNSKILEVGEKYKSKYWCTACLGPFLCWFITFPGKIKLLCHSWTGNL
jgi:hypothetical protein